MIRTASIVSINQPRVGSILCCQGKPLVFYLGRVLYLRHSSPYKRCLQALEQTLPP